MRIALRRTVAYLRDRLGPAQPPDFEAWAWGRLHTITFAHIAGRVPELSRHLNRGPYPLGGDGNTLWATGNGLTPQPAPAWSALHFVSLPTWATWITAWASLSPATPAGPPARIMTTRSMHGSPETTTPCFTRGRMWNAKRQRG